MSAAPHPDQLDFLDAAVHRDCTGAALWKGGLSVWPAMTLYYVLVHAPADLDPRELLKDVARQAGGADWWIHPGPFGDGSPNPCPCPQDEGALHYLVVGS